MAKPEIRPLKKWGQHFLEDRSYLELIARSGDLSAADRVLEIGPGDGRLTEILLASGAEVIGVEIDPRWAAFLREKFSQQPKFTLMEKDFLKLTPSETSALFCRPVKVIANLPYYVSSPILGDLLAQIKNIVQIVVLLQKEVGVRLAAQIGSREAGVLTLYLQYYATLEIINTVPAAAFKPKPKVDSAIIRIKPRAAAAVAVRDEALFWQLIRAAFAQRRKTLVNALGALGDEKFSRVKVEAGLEQLGLPPKIRGEKMKLEEFAFLCDFLVQ